MTQGRKEAKKRKKEERSGNAGKEMVIKTDAETRIEIAFTAADGGSLSGRELPESKK